MAGVSKAPRRSGLSTRRKGRFVRCDVLRSGVNGLRRWMLDAALIENGVTAFWAEAQA